MRRTAVALGIVMQLFFLSAAAADTEHTKDSLDVVKKNLADKKAVLLDVREQIEWDAGHLTDAMLMPLSVLSKNAEDKQFAEELGKKIDKKKIVYCHCRSGGRVLLANDILKKLGYEVRPLKPGFQDLVDFGFPQAKDEKPDP